MRRTALYLLIPFVLLAQRGGPGGYGRPRPDTSQQTRTVQTKPEDLCTVEGQIVNASTGAPLGKATVMLRRVESTPGAPGAARTYSASSDPSGQFVIKNVEPGKFRLSATRNGFVDADYGSRDYLQSGTTFSLQPGHRMSDVVIRMTPNGVITGHVLDEDGEPMVYLQVQAMRYRYTQGRKRLISYGSATTNDIGEYRIFGLPPGRYYISVSPRRSYMYDRGSRSVTPQPEEEYVPTFYPGTTDPAAAALFDVGPGAQVRGVDLALAKRHTVLVKGHLTNASGVSGRHPMVYLVPRSSAGSSSMNRPSFIDANGNFEIRGVASGSYTLVAAVQERERSVAARLPVEVGNASIENLNITITPPMNLSGQIRVDGQTAASVSTVQVTLRTRDPNGSTFGPSPSGRVKADGSFSIANVNPDLYSVTLAGLPDGFYLKSVVAGGQDVLTPGLDLSRGAPGGIDIVLAPNAGQVAGVVQNDQQQPAAGVTVVLIPQEKERADQPQYYKTAVTDATGSFTLKNLDPGQYKVYAWPEVESGAYMDPDFVKPVENSGVSLTIREGSQETLQLKLIGG